MGAVDHPVRKICESPRCHGTGKTEPMTQNEYLNRSAFGRLVYCEVCREIEPPRKMTGNSFRPVAHLNELRGRFAR